MAKQKKALDLSHIYYENSRKKFVVAVPMPNGSRPKKRFTTVEEAAKYRDEILNIVQSGHLALAPNITVIEWFTIWLDKYCGDLAEKTRQSYACMIRTNCKTLYKLRMVDEVKAFHITNVLENMKKKGYAHESIKRMRAVLSSAFNRVNDEQLIVYDVLPTSGCRLPKRKITGQKHLTKTTPRTAYPEAVLNGLVQAAKSIDPRINIRERWTCLILLLRVTGMRLSECLGICKKDIAFTGDKAVISLHQGVHDVDKKQSAQGKCWAVEDLKSSASNRKLDIYDKELITLLRKFYAMEHPTVSYADVEYDFLFATKSGTPILHSAFNKMFKKIRESAGSTIRVHEIRHSVATILGADRNIPFADSAKFLGHTKEVFIKHYVHAQEESGSTIAKKLTPRPLTMIKENSILYLSGTNFAPKSAPKASFEDAS